MKTNNLTVISLGVLSAFILGGGIGLWAGSGCQDDMWKISPDPAHDEPVHVHGWSRWGEPKEGGYNMPPMYQVRTCTNCGAAEIRSAFGKAR